MAAATASFFSVLFGEFSSLVEVVFSNSCFAFLSRACCLRSSRNLVISELSGSPEWSLVASACFAFARAIAAATAGLGLAIPDSCAAF